MAPEDRRRVRRTQSRTRTLRRPHPEASLEAERAESASASPRRANSIAPVAEAAQPDLTERSAASEPPPSPPERTAAIYVSAPSARPPSRPTSFRSARARLTRWRAKRRRVFPPRAWSSAAASATRSGKSRALWSAVRRLRATIPRTNGRRRTVDGNSDRRPRRAADGPAKAMLRRRAAPDDESSAQRRRGSGPSSGRRPGRPRRAGALRQSDAARAHRLS